MGKDLSACLVTVRSASEEAYQTPAFDEYVLVIEGTVKLLIGNGAEAGQSITVVAGQGAFLPKGLRVKWVWCVPRARATRHAPGSPHLLPRACWPGQR